MDGIDFVIAAEQLIPEGPYSTGPRRVLAALLTAVQARQPRNLIPAAKVILAMGPAVIRAAVADVDPKAAQYMEGLTAKDVVTAIGFRLIAVESLEP